MPTGTPRRARPGRQFRSACSPSGAPSRAGPRDCCLVNWYADPHGTRTATRFDAPVVSISLGDPARFRIGGTSREGPTQSTILRSGDVAVMGGPARLAFHGVDRVMSGEGTLLPEGGRINLTLRVVAAGVGAD